MNNTKFLMKTLLFTWLQGGVVSPLLDPDKQSVSPSILWGGVVGVEQVGEWAAES